ncbi:MAG TPA: putative sugar nucleotidyl transferase [Gemmatimonadaceae bacterium]|nr:putative sugar nucleotidyl transferase [Gemmatimonadaceae bacterium]
MTTPQRVFLHDDATARGFEPFALTRPIATLTTGMLPISARWEAIGAESAGLLAADHLADFDEGQAPTPATLPAGSIVANSRFAPALSQTLSPDESVWTADGRVVAVRLARSMGRDHFGSTLDLGTLAARSAARREVSGWWHDEVWDFLRHLPAILAADISHFVTGKKSRRDPALPELSTILGTNAVIAAGAVIEPHVVFDASAGPIFIDEGAHVHAFTRINGPCYVGRNATIMGGDITGCSIGPVSKIRGEISGTIVLGYSNKGHDGFVGNSYLGQWVNLGAGTVTSNLKNTYGEVALWTPTGIRPTGMQFLGTLFGDHVKTGIGTKLTTGTVLGAGANVFGSRMPPKAVAPFSWGECEPYDLYQIDKFLSTAATVMSRRKVELSERAKRQLAASFAKRWSVK